ncbi:MAG TPA: hypothetical protein VFO35_21235, partial [Steroidobacteraceae bacterium]|nr:hypothetical protein [Steroidobacteraceae bacterium]
TVNSIYKLSASGCKLDRIAQDRAMSFPNGIALTPDGSRLYVAHVEGISVIDVRTGKRTQLSVPKNAAVNSIDGLVWQGKDLLGIQPTPYLARVARIRLGDGGLSIREVTTMSSRPPPGLNLATGVVVNDHYYIAANVPDAAPGQQQQLRSTILRSRVR